MLFLLTLLLNLPLDVHVVLFHEEENMHCDIEANEKDEADAEVTASLC